MKKFMLALAVAALIAAPVLAAPADSGKSSSVSLGDFAVRLAVSLGAKPVDAKSAVETLKARGAKISHVDLSARVTEGEAARILSDIGVAVTTPTPGKSLSAGKADQLLSAASLNLDAAVSPSTELPGECLNNKNRGLCVDCCKIANGCTDLGAPCEFASPCAKFCKQVTPPGHASPSEPQP